MLLKVKNVITNWFQRFHIILVAELIEYKLISGVLIMLENRFVN
jgi:hypothetical protein